MPLLVRLAPLSIEVCRLYISFIVDDYRFVVHCRLVDSLTVIVVVVVDPAMMMDVVVFILAVAAEAATFTSCFL